MFSTKRPLLLPLLFLQRSSEYEKAGTLRRLISETLQAPYGVRPENVYGSFTFVTDCAARMLTIFGAFASPSHITFSVR